MININQQKILVSAQASITHQGHRLIYRMLLEGNLFFGFLSENFTKGALIYGIGRCVGNEEWRGAIFNRVPSKIQFQNEYEY